MKVIEVKKKGEWLMVVCMLMLFANVIYGMLVEVSCFTFPSVLALGFLFKFYYDKFNKIIVYDDYIVIERGGFDLIFVNDVVCILKFKDGMEPVGNFDEYRKVGYFIGFVDNYAIVTANKEMILFTAEKREQVYEGFEDKVENLIVEV